MLIGDCCVSTDDQTFDLHRDAMKAADCQRVYEDKAGRAQVYQPGLKGALTQLREGDTLVVERLNRPGRSLDDLILRAKVLYEQDVGLRSHQENMDVYSASGQPIFHIPGALHRGLCILNLVDRGSAKTMHLHAHLRDRLVVIRHRTLDILAACEMIEPAWNENQIL